MKLEFSVQIFEKYSNIKFNENSYSGSRVIPCGHTDRQTDSKKPIAASNNSVSVPKFVPVADFKWK